MYVSEILDDVRQYTGQQNDDELFSILTKAVVLLSNKGEGIWDPLIGLLDICSTTDGCLITLPRDVDTPLALSINGSPRMFRNKWFEFHINGGGWRDRGFGLGTSCGWYYDDRGDFPTYMDILTPSYLAAIADLRSDLKAALRVYGYDVKNKWIRTQDVNGNWGDGFLVPLNLSSDYPMGLPIPSGTRLFIRNFAPSTATEFVSPTAHGLTTGAAVVLSIVTPPLPAPLLNGITYYVRVFDSMTVSLYATQSDAVVGVNPISLTSVNPLSVITLDDQRVVAVQTKFNTATPHNIQTGQTVTFSGTTMPIPIVAGTTYYAFVLDANNFTVHANATDAVNGGQNPIDVSTPGSGNLTVNASQSLNPYTVFNFAVNHDFLQGDIVFASNTGGALPNPLLPQTSYFVHFISASQISLHTTLADATANVNPIVLTTPGSGTNALYKTLPASVGVSNPAIVTATGHNLSNGDLISFTTTGTLPTTTPPLALNTNYKAASPITDSTFELKTLGSGSVATASRQRTTNVATIVTGVAHGLVTGNYADISGMGDVSFNAAFVQVTVTNATTFTYANAGVDVVLTPDVGGTVQQSQTFNCTGQGSGQLFIVISRAFTIGFTSQLQTDTAQLTTGISVNLATNGALPSASPALSTSTTYFPRVINSKTVELYETQAKALDSTARATATRARAANVATITTAANHGFSTNDYVDITGLGGTAYNVTHVQITVTGATTFTYANTGGNEAPTADVGGFVSFSKIQIFSLGSGTLSLVLARLTSALLRSNLLTITSTAYLSDGAIVKFQTDGTLPAPLVPLNPYTVVVTNQQIEIHDATTNAVITLTNIGSGNHTLNIQSNFSILIPTTYVVPSNEYLDGDAVIIQASPNQVSGVTYVAPTPLVIGTTYYIRSIDNDTIELYDTKAHAQAAGNPRPTTGRVVALSTATGQGQLAQTVADFQVQNQGLRVQKDKTNGFIGLYALDTARSNTLTQIGYFYPDETTPSYRRIRVESSCAWVRMRYKRRVMDIASAQDFIPLTSRLAILYSCKAVQLLQDNYYDEGKKFEDLAEEKLKEEFNARMGPDAPSMQVNAWITTGVYAQGMM